MFPKEGLLREYSVIERVSFVNASENPFTENSKRGSGHYPRIGQDGSFHLWETEDGSKKSYLHDPGELF
jgi:hypothetical protein